MASVARCPHCEHELLIPDGADLSARVKCPACYESFQLEETMRRELSELLPSEQDAPADANEDIAAVAASHDRNAPPGWEASVPFSSARTIDEFAGALDRETPADGDEIADEEDAAPTLSFNKSRPFAPSFSNSAPEETSNSETDEPAQLSESAEVAAERIEKWFRSAKTVSDFSPVHDDEVGSHDEPQPSYQDENELAPPEPLLGFLDSAAHEVLMHEQESTHANASEEEPAVDPNARTLAEIEAMSASAHAGATIELSPEAMAAADADFELDAPSQGRTNTATWDDPEHMDRLLADVENYASDDFAPVMHQSLTPAESEGEPGETAEQHEGEDTAWMSAPPPRTPRQRSVVRMLVTSAVGGIVGLAIAYYCFLLVFGPKGDFLRIAAYVPSMLLPASFPETPASLLDRVAVKPSHDEAAAPPAETETASEPSAPVARKTDTDDRYAVAPATANLPSNEPPRFDEPPTSKPLGETPAADAASGAAQAAVVGAPSYKADELAVALREAQKAQPGLVGGDLSDKALQRVKGESYSALCALAEKLTFVDAASSPSYATALERDSESLFRNTLADAHARGEVARIVPIWIGSSYRRHGGVFFAGTITGQLLAGSVTEYQVDLGSGTPMTVLVGDELAGRLAGSTGVVGFIGSIVEDPAKRVTGYTGTAAQAIWVGRVVPLN